MLERMPVVVSLLRGVNVGGRNKIKMETLRGLFDTLGFEKAQTYVQSGNVVFRTRSRSPSRLAGAIENAIELTFGFRCAVILRTAEELRSVVERNPFAGETDIAGNRLLVTFFARELAPEARDRVLAMAVDGERVHLDGREMYIYFPNGMSFSKLVNHLWSLPIGTGRNWNTVCKLLAMAEAMERR